MRADHGHGSIFRSIMSNVQPRAFQDVLDAGAGLFHATSIRNLMPILRDGVLKMGRAASMWSMYRHLDTLRAKGMQRFDSQYDIIISLRTEGITKFVPLKDMFCCVWKCIGAGPCATFCLRPHRPA